MSSEIKQDLEVPYEIRLLEEIADELEIWARERKTDFRAKIDEALPEIQKYKTIDDFLSVLSTKPEIPEFYPLIRYFSIPDHYEELTTIKEWFQFNQRFHLSNMLIRYSDDTYMLNDEILRKICELGNYANETGCSEFRLLISYFTITFSQTIPALIKRLRIVVKMANAKKDVPEKVGKEEERPQLTDTERFVIEALDTNVLTGEDLARKAEYPYNSNFKSTLSGLRKRGILGNKAPGYFVDPKYHFLLKKPDNSQGKRQD